MPAHGTIIATSILAIIATTAAMSARVTVTNGAGVITIAAAGQNGGITAKFVFAADPFSETCPRG